MSLNDLMIVPNQSDELAYYVRSERSGKREDGLLPASLVLFEKMKLNLMTFDMIYIFTDDLSEGIEKVNFFKKLGTCKIIVITHNTRYARIYRQLADIVITSQPDKNQYHWLINKESITS
jgi:hypothetical protein